MQLHRLFLPGLLAGVLPLAGFAQTTETAPLPRYYGGLGVYQFPSSTGTSFAPVVPTFGLQFRPRWAVQVSMAFRPQRYDYEDSYTYQDNVNGAPGQYHDVTYSGTVRSRAFALPVLVRYTLTRPQQHRFQADLLGGITWIRRASRYDQRVVDRVQNTDVSGGRDDAYHNLYATVGPSLRYRVWKGLEVTSDLTFQLLLDNSWGLNNNLIDGNVAAGLRYRFGH